MKNIILLVTKSRLFITFVKLINFMLKSITVLFTIYIIWYMWLSFSILKPFYIFTKVNYLDADMDNYFIRKNSKKIDDLYIMSIFHRNDDNVTYIIKDTFNAKIIQISNLKNCKNSFSFFKLPLYKNQLFDFSTFSFQKEDILKYGKTKVVRDTQKCLDEVLFKYPILLEKKIKEQKQIENKLNEKFDESLVEVNNMELKQKADKEKLISDMKMDK